MGEIHVTARRGGRSRHRAAEDSAPRGSGSVRTERCPDPGVRVRLSNTGPRLMVQKR